MNITRAVAGLSSPNLVITKPRGRFIMLPDHRDDLIQMQVLVYGNLTRIPDHNRIGGIQQRLGEFVVEIAFDLDHPGDPRVGLEGRKTADRTVYRLVRVCVQHVGDERMWAGLPSKVGQQRTIIGPVVRRATN